VATCPSCGREVEGDFTFCPHCGTDLAAPRGREQRKTVTLLFCDVTGSTALGESVDPEALRALLARYFERMKAIVEHHGGTVEKFIGDAVMAVFGVPVAHEDDAMRAVRAAAEMRDALPDLGVQARIGVNTGEVVTGTEERLATGDAVNVAARLEQAAGPGHVLIGASTLTLVREGVEVEPVEPLVLKGKAEPVPAYRLVRVHEAPERSHGERFVGRNRELASIGKAWKSARGVQRCELVTVVGDAGVGKSRLVEEALASIDATIVRGRCLPYGEGITYWPVVGVLKQLDVLPPDETAAEVIRSLLGAPGSVTSAEDIAWAFRKTLEHAATMRPLVVVLDDVHWGEATFLDLVEHVALLASGAPILLLCMARPELTENRPGWPVTLRLEPLPAEDVDELIPETIGTGLRDRIARAAGGNPLFVHEIVAMASQAEGDVAVPPTLQALLGARLDQLESGERRVLERGAVEGEIFHRGAVQTLTPEEPQVTPRLAALVRRELIRPDAPLLPGEDGFRFRHLLVRDAAYDALPKATRAELHERFAAWLEAHGPDLVELDEILGFHLEQACLYRAELGLPRDETLAETARTRLTAAGRRADRREDHVAAENLLSRAAALAPSVDVVLELEVADALHWQGRGPEAVQRAQLTAERSAARGDRVGELCAQIHEAMTRMWIESEPITERQAAFVAESLPIFEAAGDDYALHLAYRALGDIANVRAQMDDCIAAFEQAALHAQRAGLQRRFGHRDMARFYGSTPLSALLAWQEDQEGHLGSWPRGRRALALAMLGRGEEGRRLADEVRAEAIDRGLRSALGALDGEILVELEILLGNPEAAVAAGEEGCRVMEELGQKAVLSTSAGRLARAYCELGRFDKAEEWARRSEEVGASDDVITQMLWRQARARVLAARGEHAEAELLAREAVALGDPTQMLDAQAEAYADLAEVLERAGQADEAAAAFEDALGRFERKENLVRAGQVRERLVALKPS
jgi:class 3 adenylate cyclase/tetratricopeptide (TPR) repeat protein